MSEGEAAAGDALEEAWVRAGWGPRLAHEVREHDPPQLFSLRWPLGWEADTLRLVPPQPHGGGGAGGTRPDVNALDRLRAWHQMPGAIVTQRLTLRLTRDGEPSFALVATLTASLADVGAAPPPAEIDAQATPVQVGCYEAVRISTVRDVPIGDQGMIRLLVVRHLLHTEYGTLAVALGAPQVDFHDVLEPLFAQVVQTIQLDPWAPAT